MEAFRDGIFYLDVRRTKPRTTCKWCKVSKFANSDNLYAECVNQKVTGGMYAVNIVERVEPLSFDANCKNCKHFEDNRQQTLF